MTKDAASPDLYPRKVAVLFIYILPGQSLLKQCSQGPCVFFVFPAKCTPRTSWGTRGDIGGYFVSNVVTVIRNSYY